MFTGLVQEVGKVISRRVDSRQAKLRVKAKLGAKLQLGDSVAVNGACLTVTALGADWLEADIMPKTWEATNLKYLAVAEAVNLEPALKVGDHLGGHWVSGHVDGVGCVKSITPQQNAVVIQVRLDETLAKYLTVKGSVALDGVSLTVQGVTGGGITVSVIPHTFANTRFFRIRPGDRLNVEVDLMAKQIREMAISASNSGINADFLRKHGYIQ